MDLCFPLNCIYVLVVASFCLLQAFGAPTIVTYNEDGKPQMFFGSDRFELMAHVMGTRCFATKQVLQDYAVCSERCPGLGARWQGPHPSRM